jgi:polyketide biosynthesis enoyl-CoA hydratase PksH
MKYETLLVKDLNHGVEVILNRVEKRNSINATMLSELHQVLDLAESTPQWTIIIIKGQDGFFCTGMDFKSVFQDEGPFALDYMHLLKRFASISKIIITLVEGRVMAGGVGLVAASDYLKYCGDFCLRMCCPI